MGVETITTTRYTCDHCDREIEEKDTCGTIKWTDWNRIEHDRAITVTVASIREFATTTDIICKRCAADVLRRAIQEIEE